MILVGIFQKFIFVFSIILFFVSGISYASHFQGNLQVFFPGEISAISLASVGTFCVARQNADPTALKAGIDWACGPGLANCGPIQPGQPCYVANNIVAIASYAYNAYYQANQATGGTCSFGNTAMLTNIDPSSGSCIFPGRMQAIGLNYHNTERMMQILCEKSLTSTGGGTSPGSGNGNSGSPNSTGSPGTGFTPPSPSFQPTYNDNGVLGLQDLKLVYLTPLLFLSLILL